MNISRFKRPYWHRLRQRRINALEPINWERVHEMLITDLDTLSAANKSCIEMKRLSLEENHYRWERGTLVGFSEKIPNRNPDVKEKIFTPLYSEWISYDCKDKNYVVGVLSPGKEAHSDWKHNRYDKSGESSCNHNDVLPTILLDGKVAFKPLTFEEIFDGFARMVHNDKLAAFILRHILLRMAFCIDHELDGGNVRWKPPQEIMDIIYQRIPVILINDEWRFPTEIFLHLIEVLAINEDSKVFTLGNDSNQSGRTNTIMTMASIISFLLNEFSIGYLGGKLASQPSGLAPITQWLIWETSPLFDRDFDVSYVERYVGCTDKVPKNQKDNDTFKHSKRCYYRRNCGKLSLQHDTKN